MTPKKRSTPANAESPLPKRSASKQNIKAEAVQQTVETVIPPATSNPPTTTIPPVTSYSNKNVEQNENKPLKKKTTRSIPPSPSAAPATKSTSTPAKVKVASEQVKAPATTTTEVFVSIPSDNIPVAKETVYSTSQPVAEEKIEVTEESVETEDNQLDELQDSHEISDLWSQVQYASCISFKYVGVYLILCALYAASINWITFQQAKTAIIDIYTIFLLLIIGNFVFVQVLFILFSRILSNFFQFLYSRTEIKIEANLNCRRY